ncbi:hypothetical protein [Paraliomyxa miuraensis]|uniref:hypothetical protein n=1 Tax=Paraliomyxa miuraensis TaxID=376150 RepID=UPI002258D79C|nr:hypothetical protein [Paraliomyxa miuraensis]MCX4243209.1 hypothetical protein [Paraliomyxa miuraensis]
MSRYVHVTATALADLEEIASALEGLGLPFERRHGQVMLEGSLECPGEPVDLRLPAGTLDTVEDFGFVRTPDGLRLVCGELDQRLLAERFLPPLRAAVTEARVRDAASEAGLAIEHTTVANGRRRLVLRRR